MYFKISREGEEGLGQGAGGRGGGTGGEEGKGEDKEDEKKKKACDQVGKTEPSTQ